MSAIKSYPGVSGPLCDGTDPEGNVFQLAQVRENESSNSGWEASRVEIFDKVFPKIKSRFDERRAPQDGLLCKQGSYQGCLVLKLQKSTWTNDRMDQVWNETGIFFSIWIDENAARKRRSNYNIHALKLRRLTDYAIASRDFANDFRSRFAFDKALWPNVSVDYGPATLMQAWIEAELKTFEEDALILMKHYLNETF